jgi:hypothetical protein
MSQLIHELNHVANLAEMCKLNSRDFADLFLNFCKDQKYKPNAWTKKYLRRLEKLPIQKSDQLAFALRDIAIQMEIKVAV